MENKKEKNELKNIKWIDCAECAGFGWVFGGICEKCGGVGEVKVEEAQNGK